MTLRQRVGGPAAEFAIVVVGVLVALAVDQAWQTREDSDLAAFYLTALEDDLQEDSIVLARTITQARAVRESAASLEAFVLSTASPGDSEGFLGDVTRLLRTLRFEPNSATFEDMTGSGNLRLIRNPELRNRLQRYSIDIAGSAESVLTDGLQVGRGNLPAPFLTSSAFVGLSHALDTPIAEELSPLLLMDPDEILTALRARPAEVREWLRRRQLHASFVLGECDWRLTNQTLPMLEDIRDERAGRPLVARD